MSSEIVRQLREISGVQGIVIANSEGEVVEETVGVAAERVAAFVRLLKEVADGIGHTADLGQLERAVLSVDDTRLLVVAGGGRLTGMLLDADSSPLLVGKSVARILSGTS
jgi:predicted regulator of Ras-like GTPase activity (Roadblock/LC7/MglB family)